VVVEVLDDHAREHDPRAAADAEDRREQTDPSRHLLARELVADDAEGEREDAAGDALDDARRDQHRQRGRHGGEQGAEDEDGEGPEEQLLLAVHVAEAADDRGADRGGQQVAGEQPGDARLGGVELLLHRRQRRDDERAQHRVGKPAEREHGEGDVGVGAVCGLGGHRKWLGRGRFGPRRRKLSTAPE